jgi:hypothetical protein
MARIRLGKVRGADGLPATVEVYEDTLDSYRLKVTDVDSSFITPNLRGATFRSAELEVFGEGHGLVPFSDLGLDPDQEYMFYAAAGLDYPLLRHIVAIRVGDAVRISIYYDTLPYTKPQLGSPFLDATVLFGAPDLYFDNFDFGEQVGAEAFPVNLLCFLKTDTVVVETEE